MSALEELHRDFPEIETMLVYIREAHASDEWRMKVNTKAGVCLPQPRTLEERCAAARAMLGELALQIPVAVDGMDDAVAKPYGAWPERIYVIDADGRIAYQGAEGPRGFSLDEARTFLEQHLGPSVPSR